MTETNHAQIRLPLEFPEGCPETYKSADYPLGEYARAFTRKFGSYTPVEMKFSGGEVFAKLTAFEDRGMPGSVPVDYAVGEEQFRELEQNLRDVRERLVADYPPKALESSTALGRDFRDITGGITLCETALTKFSAITPELIDSIKRAGAEEYRAETLAGKAEAVVERVKSWMPGNDGLG